MTMQNVATPSPEQMLVASGGTTEVTQEDVTKLQATGADGRPAALVTQRPQEMNGAVITHQTAGRVRMYKPVDIDPRTGKPQRYTPRLIPNNVGSIQMAVRNGFLAACPDCGRNDCMANGDQNDCPGRQPRQFRTCPHPLCHKRIYDPLTINLAIGLTQEDEDPNEIHDDAFVNSTPATRTLSALAAHVLTLHPQEAPSYGFYPTVEMRQPLSPTPIPQAAR